jgi:hypothetical protein
VALIEHLFNMKFIDPATRESLKVALEQEAAARRSAR